MQLKKKKMYETQLEQVDNNIARVNEQQVMLENQRTTAETVLALQQGVRANKATMQVSIASHSACNCCLRCAAWCILLLCLTACFRRFLASHAVQRT